MVQRCAGSIMDMKVQGSRSGKALGIGELFASTCSASAPLDSIIDIIRRLRQRLEERLNVQIIRLGHGLYKN